ncbi:MAG: capsid portal protein [Gammaproteobacteria bacterium]|nr:MAG: capsid portal protein [Gammaproteobacteria bacterium]
MSIEIGQRVSVMDISEVINMLDSCYQFDGIYHPPVSFQGLAKTLNLPFHGSCIHLKKNILSECFNPHTLLSRQDFTGLALDFLLFGNATLLDNKNMRGATLNYQRKLMKYMRRKVENPDQWVEMSSGGYFGTSFKTEFNQGDIGHVFSPDVNQELYGMPEWLSGLNGALLNEKAQLFRRAYYENGNHAGFILYLRDPDISDDEAGALADKIKNIKGENAFKNILVHSAGGEKGGIELVPMGEVTAKDEFFNVNRVSRDNTIASHRMIPQFLGVQAESNGGYGDIEKAAMVIAKNEIYPIFRQLELLNDWSGEQLITFDKYKLEELDEITQ